MTIRSYFYDSTTLDPRTYAATDFANAFKVITNTGVLLNPDGTLGLDIDSPANPIIYAGKAVVEGRFIEVTGSEAPTIPTGSYNGQIVLRVDADGARTATIVAKNNRTPTQTTAFYELPLWDIVVSNGAVTSVTDRRIYGGALVNAYTRTEADTLLASKMGIYTDTNGGGIMERASIHFYGTNSANANFLVSIADTAHTGQFIIMFVHYHHNQYMEVSIMDYAAGTVQTNTLGTITVNGFSGTPKFTITAIGRM